MENQNKKYYLTDVFDVNQKIKDGFTQREKMEIITEEVNGELREIFTKSKIFVVDSYQTFNSRPFLRSNSNLYGIKKQEISTSELSNRLNNASGDEIRNYIDQVVELTKRTIEAAFDGEKKLLFTEMSFIESFNAPYEKILNEPTTKRL